MSKYTTEVRFVCETYAGFDTSQGYGKVIEIINDSWEKVFDFDFPIFDESYRSVLCKKILMHYYTREIGLETVGLWKLKLMAKLNDIMPYYNQLYKSALIEFNPMYDVDYTKEHEGQDTGNGNDSENRQNNYTETDNGTEGATRYDLYSETPQGALTGVNSETYLTDARKITDNSSHNRTKGGNGSSSKTGTNAYSSTNEYTEHVFGTMPGMTYSKRLQEFRETFLNIDLEVIKQLADLFMLVY